MKTHSLLTRVSVVPLQHQLAAHPERWGEHSLRKTAPGSAHVEMTDIWARFRPQSEISGPQDYLGAHLSAWYPAINDLPAIRPIVFHIMSLVQGEQLGGVLLTKLQPGGKIAPHTDLGGWHAEYYSKFYVAVQNGLGSVFGWEDGDVNAKDGEVYWFRNDVPHWVNNDSDQERISMIVCIRTDQGPGVFQW